MFSELLSLFCKEVHTKNKIVTSTMKESDKFELQSIILDDFGRRRANFIMEKINENFILLQ